MKMLFIGVFSNKNSNSITNAAELSQKEEFKDDVLSSEQIVADLAKLYHSKKWTDVTLAVKDRRFKAHRLILSTRCRYFKELFESEPDKVLFDLDSAFDPDVFEIVLEYIYSGNMVANRKISDDITEISLKLGLTEVRRQDLSADMRIYFLKVYLTDLNVLSCLEIILIIII
jgi:hypothetical protein